MILLYIIGGLGIFIFFKFFLIPYIKKILLSISINRLANKCMKNNPKYKGKFKELKTLNKKWIKSEEL